MLYFLDFSITGQPTEILLQCQFKLIHGWLGSIKNTTVGLYFPEYSSNPPSFGACLRLIGEQAQLEEAKTKCTRAFSISPSCVQPIPLTTTYVSVTRFQLFSKANERRIARRAGGEISLKQQRLRQEEEDMKTYPRIKNLITGSGKVIPSFVIRQILCSEERKGEFNSYGLAKQDGATLPFF